MRSNLEILQTFDIDSLPHLDIVVLGALELFQTERLPALDMRVYRHPLVVGSGNAEATGRIIFEETDAVFASESTYEEKLKNIRDIDGVVLLSASGGKHAPAVAKRARELGKKVTLVTNNDSAPAREFLDSGRPPSICVFPKNREPYTYNTSTYMGMILGYTKEDPKEIRDFVSNKVNTMALPDFSAYDKFYLIVPAQFSSIRRMLQIKFIELFGRRIARDVETDEYVKHATTVVPSNELFISFGYENTAWGEEERRLNVPLPPNAGYGAMMAVSYYVIGQIQKAHPPYFKDNIVDYTRRISDVFGEDIKPIVE